MGCLHVGKNGIYDFPIKQLSQHYQQKLWRQDPTSLGIFTTMSFIVQWRRVYWWSNHFYKEKNQQWSDSFIWLKDNEEVVEFPRLPKIMFILSTMLF